MITFLVARFYLIASFYFIYFHSNCAKYSRNLLVGLSTRFLLLLPSLTSFRGFSLFFFQSALYETFLSFSCESLISPPAPSLVPQTGRPKEASNVALSSLSIWADSVELPSSKVRASNEAINKSTALTGLSTLFVRDDVSILEFFSCLRVHEVGPISSILDWIPPLSVPLARLSSIKPSLPSFFRLVADSGMPFCESYLARKGIQASDGTVKARYAYKFGMLNFVNLRNDRLVGDMFTQMRSLFYHDVLHWCEMFLYNYILVCTDV